MVLNLVNQFLGVLHPNPKGKRLGLKSKACLMKHLIHIMSRMSGGQHQGTSLHNTPIGESTRQPALMHLYAFNPGAEMNLPPAITNCFSHPADDIWQAIAPNMGMSLVQDLIRSSKMMKHTQHPVIVPSFPGAGIKFPIRESTGPALSKAIVGFRIQTPATAKHGNIFLALAYLLTPFQNNRTEPQFYQSEGSKKPGRSGTSHQHPGLPGNILRMKGRRGNSEGPTSA
jgi:hypothetical protein